MATVACVGDDPPIATAPTTGAAQTDGGGGAITDGGSTDAPAAPTPDATVETPKTCAALLAAAPSTKSGVYTIDPDGDGPQSPFSAYCDMATDEGGWTLLITLAPTTVTNNFNSPQAWPTTIATEFEAPKTTGLYQGTLAPFHDVREEIASNGSRIYGRNKSEAELEKIRNQYGWQTRRTSAPHYSDRPACRATYAGPADDIAGCSNFPQGNETDQSTLGWAQDADPNHTNGCWFARGNIGSTTPGGSSLCNGDPDGTRWARTWFR
jgi:hypothetical protein